MVPWEPSPPRQCGGGWTLCDCCCWLLLPAVLLVLARPDKLAAFPTSLSDCQTPTGWNCSGKHRSTLRPAPPCPVGCSKLLGRAPEEATSAGDVASAEYTGIEKGKGPWRRGSPPFPARPQPPGSPLPLAPRVRARQLRPPPVPSAAAAGGSPPVRLPPVEFRSSPPKRGNSARGYGRRAACAHPAGGCFHAHRMEGKPRDGRRDTGNPVPVP